MYCCSSAHRLGFRVCTYTPNRVAFLRSVKNKGGHTGFTPKLVDNSGVTQRERERYIYIYTHTYIYIYTHAHIHTYTHTHGQTHIHKFHKYIIVLFFRSSFVLEVVVVVVLISGCENRIPASELRAQACKGLVFHRCQEVQKVERHEVL